MKTIHRANIIQFLAAVVLISCSRLASSPETSTTSVMETGISFANTEVMGTQIAIPTATQPPISTSTPAFFDIQPTTLPSPTITPTSIYEAEHQEIKKVITSYFEEIYSMHNSFQMDEFGNTVSTSEQAQGFRQTELRKQAVEIVWARRNLLRYASYHFTLDFSEIVVFNANQNARANFTEGNAIVYELSIPYGIVSQMAGVKHIMILQNEDDGWKIIYDVHDDYSHRSLYAPTPFPMDVLDGLDKQLIQMSEGQSGPALPDEVNLFIPSDIEQLERWEEYETALAQKLLPQYPREKVLCEWELTEKSEQRINVWAICITTITSADVGNYYFPAASVPAVILLDSSGEVQSVEIPRYGDSYIADFWRLFPDGAWENHPNILAMEKHLHWRRRNPAEPPLIVLNATAILTVTPVMTPTP